MNQDRKSYWEDIHTQKTPKEVSWYQTEPTATLDLIEFIGIDHNARIIDIGGGVSVLVDKLLDKGFQHLTVLDISSKSLDYTRERLGKGVTQVSWIEADVTEFDPPQQYDLWHDRAVFHFLTSPEDRKKYIEIMGRAVKLGGHIIIASFALDGPIKCSGLNVERYSPEKLKQELGDGFLFVKSIDETHVTPWQSEQKFMYCYFKKQNG